MSLRCLRDPTLPVGLADELESFVHVLIYNGVRFLFHNFAEIAAFVNAYFDDTVVDDRGKKSAPHAKDKSITMGRLTLCASTLVFTKRKGQPGHPMNGLLQELFALLKSRYRVLLWKAAQEAEAQQKKAALSTPDRPADEEEADFGFADDIEVDEPTETPVQQTGPEAVVVVDSEPTDGRGLEMADAVGEDLPPVEVPTKEDYDRAAKLETHNAVISIFQTYITNPTKKPAMIWPKEDKLAFDRLHGYRARPRVTPVAAENPTKRANTEPANPVPRSETRSGKGKDRDRADTPVEGAPGQSSGAAS